MKQLGLTGSIGSGKSTVAARFAARGAEIVDADRFARQATEDPAVLAQIARELGEDLVIDGRLDRAGTAERVFDDEFARRKLNAIVHPEVRRLSRERAKALLARPAPPELVIHDVPLLFESGLQDDFDATAAVVAPLHVRVQRVVARSGLPPKEVVRRDAAQMPQDEKARLATYVIDNSGPMESIDAQVEWIWRELVGLQR